MAQFTLKVTFGREASRLPGQEWHEETVEGETMWATVRRHGSVAGCAAEYWSGHTLESQKLELIIGLGGTGDGMGAIMTGLARHAAVASGHAIEGLVLGESAAMAGSVVTARLVQPGIGVLGDVFHRTMAVDARHASC